MPAPQDQGRCQPLSSFWEAPEGERTLDFVKDQVTKSPPATLPLPASHWSPHPPLSSEGVNSGSCQAPPLALTPCDVVEWKGGILCSRGAHVTSNPQVQEEKLTVRNKRCKSRKADRRLYGERKAWGRSDLVLAQHPKSPQGVICPQATLMVLP